MTRTRYLHLEGLNFPVLFEDAAPLEAMVPAILPGWPFSWSGSSASLPPFAVLRRGERRDWSITLHRDEPREWNAVDALCDLVAELAWERIRARTGILSLHAAAIDFGGRLVVFPNVKRSGKSTLSVALARLGHRLFSDDVLPVDIDGADRWIAGLGSGVAPRLRLPLPETFSPGFAEWAANDPGPGNRRYKYIAGIDIAAFGATLPLGAIVVLDRQAEATPPRLDPMDRSEVLARIIHQNFSRDQHSARILKALDRMTAGLPHFCLRYSSGEEAAAFLHDHALMRDLPAVELGSDVVPTGWAKGEQGAFDPDGTYVRADGVYEAEADQGLFLSDRNGAAIHRLNPGSALIWRVLAEPVTGADITTLLCAAFEDVAPEQIASDTERTLREFAKAGLVLPVR